MSFLRHALGRLISAAIALCLLALFLNALVLAARTMADRDAARVAPLAATPLARFDPSAHPAGAEVNLRAAITSGIDVSLPFGTARLYLLADPAAPAAPARAAVLVGPADLDTFDALLATASESTAKGGDPVLDLNGTLGTPLWAAQAEAAAQDAKRALAEPLVYVRPFLQGRDAGLSTAPLGYAAPVALFLLLCAFLWSDVAHGLRRRRARRSLADLAALDRLADDIAARTDLARSGSPDWGDMASRRAGMRERRRMLESALSRSLAPANSRWVWIAALGLGATAGIVPRRPLLEYLSTHVLGPDFVARLDTPAWTGMFGHLDALAEMPGAMLADLVLFVLGPQSVGLSGTLRTLPATVWLAPVAIGYFVLQRRADRRRSLRGSLH